MRKVLTSGLLVNGLEPSVSRKGPEPAMASVIGQLESLSSAFFKMHTIESDEINEEGTHRLKMMPERCTGLPE